MKVGILTWYKALNHGAVLQTYASCKILESMDVQPVVLDYYWNLDIEHDKKENIKRYVRKFSIKQIIWHLKVKGMLTEKKKVFDQFVKSDLPVGLDYDKEVGLDAVYIGSDMVFDISEGYNPFMYGIGVDSKYIFSYAASFGYTTIDKLKNSEHEFDIINGLMKLKSIGYRDKNTLNIIKHYKLNSPIFECIDPVLCYGFEEEIENWDSGKWRNKKYIVIYAYDSTMNDSETVKEIKSLAKEEGLCVISCGYYHKWCDECVQASPKEFLEMFKHAKYIITDTFHGTVFSLILHKSFISIVRTNGFKLKYLLQLVDLTDRIPKTPEDIKKVMGVNPNFTKFDEWVVDNREKSRTFIASNIEGATKYEG